MSITINERNKSLNISIPLTSTSGKIRIKSRSMFNEYGIPVATCQKPFNQYCYVEWQIGYDVVTKDLSKMDLTTIKDKIFIGANGKEKTLYELSEYIYYFYKWKVINRQELLNIKKFLSNLTEEDFIDNPNNFSIERSQPIIKNVLGIDFAYTQVKYPMLVHKFGKYEILTEIKVTEKQRAIGVQPMLYLCFPIQELKTTNPLLNRIAQTKESANFIVDKNNISIFLELLKIFGILSKAHNSDIISIMDTILKN